MSITWTFSDVGRMCTATGSIVNCAKPSLAECIGQQVYRHLNHL